MQNGSKLSINVKIDERSYPLVIEQHEEERYRKAAKIINDIVLQYRRRYADKDAKDFLAMTAFQFVLKNLDLQEQTDVESFNKAVQALTEQIDQFLSSHN